MVAPRLPAPRLPDVGVAVAAAKERHPERPKLDRDEEQKAKEEESLNANITYEVINREGKKELERSSPALAWSALALLYLFIPIFIVVLFSFNDNKGRFNFTWQGFTLDHWKDPFASQALTDAMKNSLEIAACRPWLEAEVALIKPDVIVALGATAAQALLGPQFRVTKQRGEFIPSTLAPYVMATVHPSSILRAPDDEARHLEMRLFIDDLKKLAKVI